MSTTSCGPQWLYPSAPLRTIVYIDGFNLYYGACRAPGRKWLDIGALCRRRLPNDQIFEICFFTANVKREPQDPGKQDRQRIYHHALQTIPNLGIYLGRYIPKQVKGELQNPAPGEQTADRVVATYEEKGTDVNLASRMLKDGYEGRMRQAAVISNDGDLKMPIRIVREHLKLPVTVVNPVLHGHRSAALSPDPLPANAAFIRLTATDVEACQLPAAISSPKGAKLAKPPGW